MYFQLLNLIYKTPQKINVDKRILQKKAYLTTRLGSYFLFIANTRNKNHILIDKRTNSIMQWNLWIWGLQLTKLTSQMQAKQYLHKLYFFYQLAGYKI